MNKQEFKQLQELLRKFQVAAAKEELPMPIEPEDVNLITKVKKMAEFFIEAFENYDEESDPNQKP